MMTRVNWLPGFALGLTGGALLAVTAAAWASDPPAQAERDGHGARPATSAEPAIPGPEIAFQGCAYFEDAGFRGRRVDVRENSTLEWIGAAWNDRISSVACHAGCRLIGYEHINFGGARRNFVGAVAEAGAGWDNRISALRVVCTAPSPAPHGEPHHQAGEAH